VFRSPVVQYDETGVISRALIFSIAAHAGCLYILVGGFVEADCGAGVILDETQALLAGGFLSEYRGSECNAFAGPDNSCRPKKPCIQKAADDLLSFDSISYRL